MRKDHHLLIIAAVLCWIGAGCASVNELTHGIAGTSTKVLEEGRPQAITTTVPLSSSSCFERSVELLNEMGSFIYRKDAQGAMIAAYVSETDTTPVGVFFTPLDGNRTEVQVTSPSSDAKQGVSQKLFAGLAQPATEPQPQGPGGTQPQLEIK